MLKTFSVCALAALAASPLFSMTVVQGARDAREARILVYSNSGSVSIFAKGEKTPVASGKPDEYGIVKFTIKNLLPDTKYEFTAKDASEEVPFTVKTIADYIDRTPPTNVKIALLGKVHRNDSMFDRPFKTPGGGYEIYDSINAKNCDAVVWANNAAEMRPADYGSFSGIMARYAYEKADPAMKNLLKDNANYAVMSENSFGAPGSDRRAWNKAAIVEAFRRNWANPDSPADSSETVAATFRISDTEVFLLDSMSSRNDFDFDESRPEMFGKEQLYRLMHSLKTSRAKFKIIISNAPIINPAEAGGNFSKYPRERKMLLDFLLKNKIGGVIFASANKSYGEITRMVRPSAHELFEITTGATTDRPAEKASEMNFFRVPGSAVFERTFSIISVTGAENERIVTLESFNSKGESVFSQNIKESDLAQFQ